MNQELLKQSMTLFDTPEKWNAFLDLITHKDKIRNQWYNNLKEEACRKYLTSEFVEGWVFRTWSDWDMHWYLKRHGKKSISLLLGWGGELTLWCDPNYHHVLKTHDYLRTERFAPLLSCLSRIDESFMGGERLAVEKRNFSFGSPYDKKFDVERLAWYAENRVEDFLNQITEKVNRLRKNKQMNELLNELNELTKIYKP